MAKKTGRPTDYDPDFHPAEYVRLSKEGNCKTEIAATWGKTRHRIDEWAKKNDAFRDALKEGRELLEKWWMNAGKNLMAGKMKGNPTIYIWMTKNIIGWKDKIEQHNTHDFEGMDFEDDDDN